MLCILLFVLIFGVCFCMIFSVWCIFIFEVVFFDLKFDCDSSVIFGVRFSYFIWCVVVIVNFVICFVLGLLFMCVFISVIVC